MTIDGFDDELRSALLDEVPEPGEGYWQRIDATLGAPEKNDITPRAHDEAPSKRRRLVWPAIAAAALIVAGIFVIGNRWGRDGEELVSGNATSQDAGVGNGPRQNVDHWRGIYAVWDCTANDGAGGWLPEFQSARDDWGIHSHGDGLLSIHPFFEESAEENATLALFAETMEIEITDQTISLDDGRVLSEATTSCGGEPGVVQVRRWPSAPALEADADLAPRVVTTDVAGERFMNDLEVWTIAFAPLDADIPLPPRDRFDRLAVYWWSPDEAVTVQEAEDRETALPAVPSSVADARDTVRMIPDSDVSVWVRPGDVEPAPGRQIASALAEIAELAPDGSLSDDTLLPETAGHLQAAAPEVRQVIDLFLFRMSDRGQPERHHDCYALREAAPEAPWTSGCLFDDGRGLPLPVRQQRDRAGDTSRLAMWNLPAGSVSLRVTTTEDWVIVANVLGGASLAAWDQSRGDIAAIDIFDADLNILWAQ